MSKKSPADDVDIEDESIKPPPLPDRRPCTRLRVQLKQCLLNTDCVQIYRKTPRECLQSGDIPQHCKELHNLFMTCRLSIIDMRRRFRGRVGDDNI